jgi:APA family basic amino acid/polyamine antiporter
MSELTSKAFSQEENLKKVIGFWDGLSLSVGLCIGGGVIALTGVAVGNTGASVILSYVLAALYVIIMAIPIIILSSALPTTGGDYRYISRLVSPKMAGLYLLSLIGGQISLASFGISFTQYLQALLPNIPFKTVAVLFMFAIYLVNMFGLKTATKFQNILVITMLVALVLFVLYGVPQVSMDVITAKPFFLNGGKIFASTSALLGFAVVGSVGIANMGGEMKNPGKDIPRLIVISTLLVTTLYILVAIVDVGVLPYSEVAYKPLSYVAKAIFPSGIYMFFVLGGALLAITTTLNGTFQWVPRAFIVACDDNLLPKWIGKVDEKTGTTKVLNTMILIMGVVPILVGFDVSAAISIGSGILTAVKILLPVAMLRLPKLYPEAYEKSSIKPKPGMLKFLAGLVIVTQIVHTYLIFSTRPASVITTMIILAVIGVIFSIVMSKRIDIKKDF